MSRVECAALGFFFGLMSAGFLAGLVSCVAEWRRGLREGDGVAASFERAKRRQS